MAGNLEDLRYAEAARRDDGAVIMMCAFRCDDRDFLAHVLAVISDFRRGREGADEDEAAELTDQLAARYAQDTKIARVRFEETSSTSGTIRVFLSHASTGGGDYVAILRRILGGRPASLPKGPAGPLEVATCVLRALPRLARLFCRSHLPPLSTSLAGPRSVIHCSYVVKDLPGHAATSSRCRVLARVLEDVTACMTWPREEMLTWLPVAYEPSGPGERNCVGILPFLHRRGELASELEEKVADAKEIASATRFATSCGGAPGLPGVLGAGPDAVEFLRRRVECVVTMSESEGGRSDGPGGVHAADLALIGGFVRHESPLAYPAYVFNITVDGIAHVTYSFSGDRFEGKKLLKRRPKEARLVLDPLLVASGVAPT